MVLPMQKRWHDGPLILQTTLLQHQVGSRSFSLVRLVSLSDESKEGFSEGSKEKHRAAEGPWKREI